MWFRLVGRRENCMAMTAGQDAAPSIHDTASKVPAVAHAAVCGGLLYVVFAAASMLSWVAPLSQFQFHLNGNRPGHVSHRRRLSSFATSAPLTAPAGDREKSLHVAESAARQCSTARFVALVHGHERMLWGCSRRSCCPRRKFLNARDAYCNPCAPRHRVRTPWLHARAVRVIIEW